MNYIKAALIGLATFFTGFALWRLMVLSLQLMEPYLARHAASSASAPGWGISLGPHSVLTLMLLISVVVAYRQYGRLRDKNRNAR